MKRAIDQNYCMQKLTYRFARIVTLDVKIVVIQKKITSMLEITLANGVEGVPWYGSGTLNHGI